jgi:hypothetical protein
MPELTNPNHKNKTEQRKTTPLFRTKGRNKPGNKKLILTASSINGCKTKENTLPAVLRITSSIFMGLTARNLNCVLRGVIFSGVLQNIDWD